MNRKNDFLFLLILLPSVILSQNSDEETVLASIHSKVIKIDSLANVSVEEVENGVIVWSHGNMKRELHTQIRLLEKDGKLQRVCYRERKPKTDEDLSLYFENSKLIYAELTTYNKKNLSTKKLYYQNEILVFPDDDDDEVNLLVKADVLKNRKQ
ncbi:hypothetical protein [Flavobacterium selenitireducens]|uniref:hypothetical protein n=1 Tax=Flavobacterium selenitireducens TaxID=2722704 RepID=UPI00168BCAA7|nr:hypothetical protein [Flavobacterium selenitireducens]MBD3584079.1 hypothetical protein [Flavobacterium selenitireducens]